MPFIRQIPRSLSLSSLFFGLISMICLSLTGVDLSWSHAHIKFVINSGNVLIMMIEMNVLCISSLAFNHTFILTLFFINIFLFFHFGFVSFSLNRESPHLIVEKIPYFRIWRQLAIKTGRFKSPNIINFILIVGHSRRVFCSIRALKTHS